MNRPTEEQQRRGRQVAAEMFDASTARAFESVVDFGQFEFPEIVELYLAEEIDSVTGIYMAMQVDRA
jgi:hypothetical protein